MNALASFVDRIIVALFGEGGTDQGGPEDIPPFEKEKLLPWTVRKAARTALGPEDAARLIGALPNPANASDCVDFLAGAAVGAGEALVEEVRSQVEAIATAIKGLIAYYGLVYDADMWRQLLAVWLTPPGTSVEPFARFLQDQHKELYQAIVSYAGMCAQLDSIVQELRNESTRKQALAEWLSKIPLWLGRQVRTVVDQIVEEEGDPGDQGEIVGKVGTHALVQAVMIALAVYDLAAIASRGAGALVSEARLVLSDAERSSVLAKVATKAPKLEEAAAGVSKAKSAAVKLYEDLATEIAPYSRLRLKTGAFNSEVRETLGLSLSDVEYVELRLDANHIVKGEMYKQFGPEFRKVFGWERAEDMDAMALHTEWHIRSGERLNTRLNLKGAENERSLSYAMDTYIDNWQQAHGPFKNLEEVFVAHREFYKGYSPRLFERLDGWFTQKLAMIKGGL